MQRASVPFLGAILLGMALFTQAASAASEAKPCVLNPDMTIAYGDVLSGPDCKIDPVADTDTFRFNGVKGELIRFGASRVDGSGVPCIELWDPAGVYIAGACNLTGNIVNVSLPASGSFSLQVYEQFFDQTVGYNLVLERIAPSSPTAVPLVNGDVLTDEINSVADNDEFYFSAQAGDTYRISVSRVADVGVPCVEVYDPAGTYITGACNLTGDVINLPIATTGTHQLVIYEQFADQLVGYNVSLSCISGACQPPGCLLELTPSLSGTTLNFGFRLGNQLTGALFNTWLSFNGATRALWSRSIPVVSPPTSFTVPLANFPKLGSIGILTTITTSTGGIACSDWEIVATGAAAPGAAPGEADLNRWAGSLGLP